MTNIGEQEGSHMMDLKVDGEVVESGTVMLRGGEETSIIFDVTRGAGSYIVEVDGLTGNVTVKPKSSLCGKIPGFPYNILGFIAIFIIIWYVTNRKKINGARAKR